VPLLHGQWRSSAALGLIFLALAALRQAMTPTPGYGLRFSQIQTNRRRHPKGFACVWAPYEVGWELFLLQQIQRRRFEGGQLTAKEQLKTEEKQRLEEQHRHHCRIGLLQPCAWILWVART